MVRDIEYNKDANILYKYQTLKSDLSQKKQYPGMADSWKRLKGLTFDFMQNKKDNEILKIKLKKQQNCICNNR